MQGSLITKLAKEEQNSKRFNELLLSGAAEVRKAVQQVRFSIRGIFPCGRTSHLSSNTDCITLHTSPFTFIVNEKCLMAIA
jgi:hypothetical protein